MSHLRCIDSGPLATLQDSGRHGWQRFGVSVAGAMDPVGLAVANLLAGNPVGTAGIEVTLLGGIWEAAAESVRLAVAGAGIGLAGQRPASCPQPHRRRHRRAGRAMTRLLLILLLLTGPAAADDKTDAVTAYRAGDLTTAYKMFGRMAEKGDVDAVFYLGAIAYKDGMAVDAARWFCRAAESGHVGAQHNCAVLSYRGLGTPQHKDDARRWFAAAADKGHLGSAASLGAMLLEGEGGPEDVAAGLSWLRWAAAGGQPQALFALANAHELGRGVARDPKAAFDFYRRAAIAGHGEAENAIGNFHLFGAHGLKEDPAEAARWFRRAAERNNPAGAFNLGTLFWQGRGVAGNKIEAYRWLATAGLYGDDAMINRVTGVLFQLEEQMSEDEVAKAQAAVPDWENRLYRPPTTMESLVEP